VSDANVDLAHEGFAALSRGGVAAALEYFDSNVELVQPPEWPEDRVLHGHDGVRKILASWAEQFDEFRLDLERVIDVDERHVVVFAYQRGRVKDSDQELEQRLGFYCEIRDRKVTRLLTYFS
jgi:ketosteroid isomerase-like protein